MKKLTYGEHVEAGRRVKQVARLLTELQVALPNGLGKTSRAAKLVNRTATVFGQLRVELDNVVGVQCPDVDNVDLNRVYYGAPANSFGQTATSGEGGERI